MPERPLITLFTDESHLRCVVSTRHGGVSQPPYASLNLGSSTADDPRAIDENRRRFAGAAGFDLDGAARMHQVHGAAVRMVEAPGFVGEADALVTRTPGLALIVTVADCMPVFLFDRGAGVVAAVHAGWRGTAAGILRQTVASMLELGATPPAVQVAIGPAIGPCCFEVSAEVAALFPAATHRPGLRDRPHVDLGAAAVLELAAAGVRAGAVRQPPQCTRCHTDRFFSARAGEPTGRLAGMIVMTASEGRRAPGHTRAHSP